MFFLDLRRYVTRNHSRRKIQTGVSDLEKDDYTDDLRYLQNRISDGMGTKNLTDYHREETKKNLISFVLSWLTLTF